MSAGGLPAVEKLPESASPTGSQTWHGSCGKDRRRQSRRASGRSLMDKIENFIFSVALIGAGLITLVTLPLA